MPMKFTMRHQGEKSASGFQMLKSCGSALIVLLFTSCQLMHVSPTHNTPCFTDKNQFECAAGLGATGINGNLAWSPIKYVSLQANALCNLSSRYFNNQFEGGLGFYLPFKKLILGLDGGYGFGNTAFINSAAGVRTNNTYDFARFNTKKYYWGFYLAEALRNGNTVGLSFKQNLLNDFYYFAETPYAKTPSLNFSREQSMNEVSVFVRCPAKRLQSLLFTVNFGFVYFPSSYDGIYYYPFMRLGWVFKT